VLKVLGAIICGVFNLAVWCADILIGGIGYAIGFTWPEHATWLELKERNDRDNSI
jgi:hypothetical protein